MPTSIIGYLLPIVFAALAAPLALGKVPPNGFYGFRTPKTLSSPDIWYPANRIAGWLMIAAAALAICFNLVLSSMHPEWPDEKLVLWMTGTGTTLLLLAGVLSLFYLRKL
jgi:uncharacterized membrane protein